MRHVVSGGTCAVLVAIALLTTGREPIGAASVPQPTVTGPIAAAVPLGDPSRDYPYSATVDDLRTHNYIEEEFFFEGSANRYTTPPGATGAIVDGNHSYRSRLIVRRPRSA